MRASSNLLAVGALAASLAAAACQKSARQQQEEADEARRAATEAQQKAQRDVAEAERRAREAAAEVRGAPAVANADAVLAPNRGEYLRKHRDELASLDQKLASLEAEAARASGRAKVELDATVRRLREQRAAVGRQLDMAGTVADGVWSSFTENVDKAVDDLEAAIDKASR
ncbi:MAG TPA: hypothetical protein VFS43_17585 [Polyangiaceae bacterium]|nr:hypothetical protein [Polyangiaceae bacterium]